MHAAFILVVALSTAQVSPAAAELTVRVTAATAQASTKEAQAALTAKAQQLAKAMVDLRTALEQQYGVKQDAWPKEKQDEFDAAQSAYAEAEVNRFYSSGVKQKDIDDSAATLVKELGGKKGVRTVDAADQADLVVTVIGRGAIKDELSGGPIAQLVVRVEAGGRVKADALAASGASWSAKAARVTQTRTETVHQFTASAPYWLLISSKPGTNPFVPQHKGAAGVAASAIEKFAAENAGKLPAARR
jgi:hypothetical protein